MKEKQTKLPGPDHPISIQRNAARVVVSVAGRVVADTRNALTLREAAYPPVQYIPSEDVDFSQGPGVRASTWSQKRGTLKLFFEYWMLRSHLKSCPIPPIPICSRFWPSSSGPC